MKSYRRNIGFVQAVQWVGTNRDKIKQFCPKVQFRTVVDDGGNSESLYLFQEGYLIYIPQGDYLIKEQGYYYGYPRRLFEKHYDEVGLD